MRTAAVFGVRRRRMMMKMIIIIMMITWRRETDVQLGFSHTAMSTDANFVCHLINQCESLFSF
jgi:hypothetical protein